MIVTGPEVARFVSERTGLPFYPPYEAIGEEVGGQIVSGVVFNCYTRTDIEFTVATTGRFSRALLRACGRYAFDQLGCCRATITTEQPEVIVMAARIGAVVEGRKRNQYGPGRDGVVLGILREDWNR